MKKIAIFGSSGHGSDIADIAIDNGYEDIVFLSKEPDLKQYCGYLVYLDIPDNIQKLYELDYKFAIGIGDPNIRKKVHNNYPALPYPNLVHSSATIGNIGSIDFTNVHGNIFAAGSRVTNNVALGNFCFLGINSVVGHDCILRDYSSLMPSAVLSGNIELGEGVYIGSNASVRQGENDRKLFIGNYSTVGMGAVVLNDVPDNNLSIGAPSKNCLK